MTTGNENEFIDLPPGIAPERPRVEPVEPEPVEEDDLITLPPGVVDSGTYRMPQPRASTPKRSTDVPVFFPAPPGIVPVESVPVEGVPVEDVPVENESTQDGVDDATRASVGRRSAPAWRIVLPTGEQVLIERTTLIGRDPTAGDEWADAQLLPVTDPGKSVSKTHAALELTDRGELRVHDLHSTNGVYLAYSADNEINVEPGAPVVLDGTAELVCGEYAVTVSRA